METLDKHTGQRGLGIGDVAKLCGVPAHTIRFWEREFAAQLLPDRTQGRQRRFSDTDIAQIMRIKKLLWEDKFSIEGAKRLLDGTQLLPFVAPQFQHNITDIHDLALHIATFIQQHLSNTVSTGETTAINEKAA
jgi:DNA-binding transcriptional MerR regulator